MAIGNFNGCTQAQNAAQMQAYITDQQRQKTLQGIQNGSINKNEFLDIAHNLNAPRDQGPAPSTQPSAQDGQQMQKAGADLKNARQDLPLGGQPAMAAAQMQMYATDQRQAQTIYEQIASRSKNFNSLYDKYTHGDFQPQPKMAPEESARLTQIYDQVKGGKLELPQAAQMMGR